MVKWSNGANSRIRRFVGLLYTIGWPVSSANRGDAYWLPLMLCIVYGLLLAAPVFDKGAG
jgi:hypothetical protein